VKIFFACPVRGTSEEYHKELEADIKLLESYGHTVHFPPRNTNQDDPNGIQICKDNRSAIEAADVVYVKWDGKSQGVLFDLGMAFALRKPVIGYSLPPLTEGKSFQNMLYYWENCGCSDSVKG